VDDDDDDDLLTSSTACVPARAFFGLLVASVLAVFIICLLTLAHAPFQLSRGAFLLAAASGAALGVSAGIDPDKPDISYILASLRPAFAGALCGCALVCLLDYGTQLIAACPAAALGAIVGTSYHDMHRGCRSVRPGSLLPR